MLLAQATRQKSKDLLSIEIRKLESQLIALNETSSKKLDPMEVEPSTTQAHKCIQVKLNNYGTFHHKHNTDLLFLYKFP